MRFDFKKIFLCSKQLVLDGPDIPLETSLGFCANRVSDIDQNNPELIKTICINYDWINSFCVLDLMLKNVMLQQLKQCLKTIKELVQISSVKYMDSL